MVDVLATVKGVIPSVSMSGIVGVITWFIVIGIIGCVIGVGTYFVVIWLRFNKKIEIYQKIGNNVERIKTDRARLYQIGRTGDFVLYVRKSKKYLPVPSIQTGRNLYWFFVRDDGEWINVGMSDLNEISKRLGLVFVDRDMRYARIGMQRLLKERTEGEPSFLQKYGTTIVNIAAIAIILLFTWLIFQEYTTITGTSESVIRTTGEVMDKVKSVLGALDNVCSPSGIIGA